MSSNQPDPKTAPSGLSPDVQTAFKRELLFGDVSGGPGRDTRFRKGQSGNPRGRPPRRALEPAELAYMPSVQITLKEGGRRIAIREGASSRSITVREALTRKQIQDGLNGSAYAQEKALQRQEQADRIKALHVAEDHELWDRYCDDARWQFAEAKAAGAPEPLILPHPDDVIFVPGELVRLRPPLNEEQLAVVLDIRKLCELLILQDSWDERSIDMNRRQQRPTADRSAMIMCMHLNGLIPLRYRLSDNQLILKIDKAMAIPKRELLKQLYHGWRSFGRQVPRGRHVPPYKTLEPAINRCFVVAAAMTNPALDPEAMARGEFDDAARAFFEERGVPID